MRAITLWQPWASAIALGAKRIETRTWPTHHRGLIAIHASQPGGKGRRELELNNPVWRHLRLMGHDVRFADLPFGAIVATADVVDCCPIREGRLHYNPTFGPEAGVPLEAYRLTDRERDCGNYRDGNWGWLLTNVRRLEKPIPIRGARGLWTLPDDVARAALVGTRDQAPASAAAQDDLHSRIAP